jgi:AraC-like DNA-binding protein
VLREVRPMLPATVRPIVEHCVLRARTPLTVAGVARALGVHRKTLVNKLRRAGFPGPRAIIGWSRLLLAAHALEDPGRPVERIALDLEFASATAMCNMLRRYTGLRPREVRENGGVACVLHLFTRALGDAPPTRVGRAAR